MPIPNQAPAETDPAALRALPGGSNMVDLVKRIERLDSLARETGERRCLLASHNPGFRLTSDLFVGVRPPPAPPADLDARLAEGPGLGVLSRYGRRGEGPLWLVELTPSPATPQLAGLVLTDQGAYLLHLPGSPNEASNAPRALTAVLDSLGAGAQTGLLVTAEAEVPLVTLYEALAELSRRGLQAALASPLPEGTKLPAATAPRANARCPDGLPPLDAPPGELTAEQARAALPPLIEAAEVCSGRAGPRAAQGGHLTLGLRVSPDGFVRESCVMDDALDDPELEACVLSAARQLRFAASAGHVDLQLPLRLAQTSTSPIRPVCERTSTMD